MTLTQILAVWAIVSVIAAPFVGEYLHNLRVNREFRTLLPPSAVKSEGRDLTPEQWGAIAVMDAPEAERALAIVDAREPEAKAFALDAEQPRRSA